MANELRKSVMKVPPHRRPSFMATASARRVYVQSDFARKQGPTFASNSDTFAYSPKYLIEWDMPQDLWDRLPDKLTAELEGWQAAGAAVITGLARLEKLDEDAIIRGWPEKKSGHLSRTMSGSASNTSVVSSPRNGPTTMVAPNSPWRTPPQSFTEEAASPPSARPAMLPRLQTAILRNSDSGIHSTGVSSSALADTPPFTPDDVKGSNLPPIAEAFPALDANHLDDLLTPYLADVPGFRTMSPSPMSPTSEIQSPFDEGSWETFLGQYREEIQALKVHANVRFRHIRRGIDQIWVDIKREEPSPEFELWWEQMGFKQQVYDDKVQHLQVPNLEQVKAIRLERGLHV
ncbi:hypothetical protein MBLNU457_6478t1 [Dothideomycetes sp. NU457]